MMRTHIRLHAYDASRDRGFNIIFQEEKYVPPLTTGIAGDADGRQPSA
jgi:hypothetical protein